MDISKLKKDGFIVIRNALNNPDFFLEKLIKDNRIHGTPMWDIRLKLKYIFKKIWKTNKLACSFDGNVIGNNEKIDWHIDQNMSHEKGLICIQGVLALKKSNVTNLLKGSHKYFNKLSKKYTDNDDDTWESYAIPLDDSIWKKNLDIITPTLYPGDLLLFDSRLIHSVDSCKNRAVVYVSMVPQKFIDKNIKQKRINGFLNCIQTTHWCERFIIRDYDNGPFRKKIPKKYINLI